MAQVDYYRLLGVEPSASHQEIRQAYRRLARRVHPDTNPPTEDDVIATQRMAQLNEAYDVLGDPSQRAAYDRERERKAAPRVRRQGRAATYGGSTYRPAHKGRPDQIVFQPALEQQLRLGFLAMLLTCSGLIGVHMALVKGILLGAALAVGSFMGAAVLGMAALPYFQGYVVLTPEAVVEYPVFGFFPERVYPYDQICDVHWNVRHYKWGSVVRIMIDYFERDHLGRLNANCYQSKWLMRVGDPDMLHYMLRTRIAAQKHPSSRPTWRAVLIGARELIELMVLVLGAVLILAFRTRPGL
jgi:hypothetical protein